jgi:hypothetical protein
MKYTVVLILFCITFLPVIGQKSFGILGGAQLNGFRFPDNPYAFSDLYHNNMGMHLGVFMESPLNGKWQLRSQLQFIQRGSYFDNIFVDAKTRVNLIYLDLPVLLSYQISNTFFVSAGPDVSYLLYAYANTEGEKEEYEEFPDQAFDFGITSAFGWRVSDRVSVLASYYFGIAAIHRGEIFNTETFQAMPVSYANTGLLLSIAYAFPTRKEDKAGSRGPSRRY